MSNRAKLAGSILGIIAGMFIIIVGITVQDTSYHSIGEYLRFGADFYTEMYSVTKEVGRAITSTLNDLIVAVGWLIISLGIIDICFFAYKLCSLIGSDKPAAVSVTQETVDVTTPVTSGTAEDFRPEQAKNQACDESVGNDICAAIDDDYVDVVCPNCGEQLSFFKSEANAVCPWCSTKIPL